MTLDASLSTDVRDDSVAFELTVTNPSEEPVELQFRDAGRADFAVYRDGEEVWRFSHDRLFAQLLSTDSLDPDERVTYRGEWSNPSSGRYEAVGTLLARNRSVEARTEFSV